MGDKVQESVYSLTDHEEQIEAYVFDLVRAKVPTMELNDVFENKDAIAEAVKESLTETMSKYGFDIVKALVNDINPDEKVKVAMNDVRAAERDKEAAIHRATGQRQSTILQAEAEAESKALQGKGLADQRTAIAEGLATSIQKVKEAGGEELDDAAVTTLLTLVQ